MMFSPDLEHKFSNTSVPKTVRFTEKIDEELQRLQQETGVSFNQLVLQCCKYALESESQRTEL